MNISSETIQILELHKQGATVEQIATALNKDPVVIGMLLRAKVDGARKLTLEERFGDLKALAVDTLKDVAQFGDNDSARVSAAKILIDEVDGNNGHGGAALAFNYTEFAERVAVAKQRVDAVRQKALEDKAKEPIVAKIIEPKFEEVKQKIEIEVLDFEQVANN